MAYALYNVVLKANVEETPLEEVTSPNPEEKNIDLDIKQLGKWMTTIQTSTMLTANVINSKIGSYTGNKVAQNNASQSIKLVSYASASALMLATGNYLGAAVSVGGAVISYGSQVLDYAIMVRNTEQESAYKRSLRGNMATSNSRWRGDYR